MNRNCAASPGPRKNHRRGTSRRHNSRAASPSWRSPRRTASTQSSKSVQRPPSPASAQEQALGHWRDLRSWAIPVSPSSRYERCNRVKVARDPAVLYYQEMVKRTVYQTVNACFQEGLTTVTKSRVWGTDIQPIPLPQFLESTEKRGVVVQATVNRHPVWVDRPTSEWSTKKNRSISRRKCRQTHPNKASRRSNRSTCDSQRRARSN